MRHWNSDPANSRAANSRATNCVGNCFTCTVTIEGTWQCFVDYSGHDLKGFSTNVDVSTSLLSMDQSYLSALMNGYPSGRHATGYILMMT